ncbi:MAG: hypothetical protein JNM00_01135, partial [Flavobacteriales bacterium]|nr:hypothetical protein [Flavobacteriales bacterium]
NPGQTVNFCSTKICGTRVVIAASTGTTPSGSYTLTLNGQTFTGAMTSIYDVFHLDFPACGCTDPAAINYEASATIDDNGCYYDANAFCEGAKLMPPYTAMILDYTDVPYAIGLPEGCDFIAGNSRVLWYKFVYTGGTFRISTSGLQDTQLAIFDECGGNMITCLDDIFFSNDQGNSIFSLNPFATFDCDSGLISGHTYYVCAATYDAGNNPSYLMFEPVEFPGCTDPTAMNYHPCASNEDGSCVYADACPADLDNNGNVNVADMLLFMAEFGSNCNSSENAE